MELLNIKADVDKYGKTIIVHLIHIFQSKNTCTCILMPWGVVVCHGVISNTGVDRWFSCEGGCDTQQAVIVVRFTTFGTNRVRPICFHWRWPKRSSHCNISLDKRCQTVNICILMTMLTLVALTLYCITSIKLRNMSLLIICCKEHWFRNVVSHVFRPCRCNLKI